MRRAPARLPSCSIGHNGAVDAVRVEEVRVLPGRIVAEVLVDARARTATPELAAALLERFPTLAEHSCVNDEGGTLAAVLDHTSVPHLLEHLVIDLQTRAAGAADDVFVGTTEWVREREGRARVQVSFTDDLVALRALTQATRLLNELLLPPDLH